VAAGSRTLKLQILAEVSKLVEGLDKANKQVMTTGQKFQQGFEKVSKSVLVAGAAVGAFVASSVKTFIEFDSKITQSTAIMSNVTDEVRKDMETAARSIAKTLGISHTQAAESYFFLASAGLDAKQAIAALPAVANFARAGMFNMALATDLATDAQSALGLTTKDSQQNLTNLTRVTDVLVKANTLANASVEQFSTALTTKAGTAMKMFNIDVESGVAVLAAMADQGIKAQIAGSNFAIVVRDLTTKAISNSEAFEKLNIQVFDTEGNFRNMSDILVDVERALEGASDEQAKMTFKMLGFNDKSMSAIASLIGLSGKIKEYEEQLFLAGGTTQEVTDKQMQSMANQIAILQSKFEDFKIELAREFTPELTKLMNFITKKVIPFTQKYKDEIVIATKAILALSAAVIAVNVALVAYNAAMVIATVATAAFNAVLLMTPVGWVVAGIAAVVAGMIILESRTGYLRKVWQFLTEKIMQALDAFKRLANFFGADFETAAMKHEATLKRNIAVYDESRRAANQVASSLRTGVLPAVKEQIKVTTDLKPVLDEASDATNKFAGANNSAASAVKNLTALQRELNALRAGGALPSAISPDQAAFFKSELGLISEFGGKIEGINLLPTDPFFGFGQGSSVNKALQQRAGGSATATGGVVINVSGTVIDPEGAARAIEQLISDSNARGGALVSDLFGINP
jgi:TP901 family phage tail tape measure protein